MFTGNKPTCQRGPNSYIDLFILDKSLGNAYQCDNHNKLTVLPYLSDHDAIVFNGIINSTIKTNEINYKYVYKNVNWNEFNKNIESKLTDCNIPLHRNLSNAEIDHYTEKLQEIISQTINKKIKKVPMNGFSYIDESNQTKALKQNLKILQRRENRARNTNSLNEIKNSVKLIKIMINNSLANDYRQFWHSTLEKITLNSNVYENIRRCTKYGKNKGDSNIMIDEYGKAYSTPTEKANYLAKKFQTNHRIAENTINTQFDQEIKNKIVELS